MKKQINPSIKAHLLPTLFILLSLVAIAVIPFAQAQRNATKQSAVKSNADTPVAATGAAAADVRQLPHTPAAPWTIAAPVAVDHYGGFMDSNGTFAYEGGGYSFSAGGTIAQFGRFDPVANTWTPLAPVPDLNNAEASAVYAPNVNKLFVFGGDNPTTGTVVATTRIYDITTNTWTTGANMPDVRAFMASGYFNGKIYLVAGYNTGNITPAFLQTWEYDPVANTFVTKTPVPAANGFGGAGSGVINGHLYVAGGRDSANTILNTTWDYNIATDTWTQQANMAAADNVPGSAVIAGQLWVFGGGNPFAGPGTSPRFSGKEVLAPNTTNTLQVYDPGTNAWAAGPSLNQQRSFPAGTHVGNTAVAVGGYTGSTTTTSVEINVGGGTPTPTPTPTCPPSDHYTIAQIGGSIVPGTVDTGNHGDDTVVTIALPFSYALYDQTYTSINLSSNGNAQFTTTDATFTNQCLPWTAHNYTIFPYWDDLYLVNATYGIFTSISGTAPNRIFNIEWRAQYFPGSGGANFELRLYEGQRRFDVIYGTVTNGNTSATAGVQRDNTTFDQYFCNGTGGAATGGQSYILPCGTPTPTPTPTPCGAKIYNIAGFGLGSQTTTTRIYDIGTNTWSTGAAIPEPNGLSDHATGYWNGKIYVAAGYNGSGAINTLRIYDIASNSWTTGAPMPAALYLPGFGVINGKFYVASGNNGSTEVNTLYIYDIGTDTWTTGPVVPTPVTGPGSAVYQGKLYLFGGAAPFPNTTTITQIYDPVANSWSSGPPMNLARLWFYGGAVGATSIVAPGGDNSPGIPINDNEQLTGTWATKAPLPYAARGPFAVSDGTFVYIGGGYDGSTVHADTLRYDPVADTYTPLAPSGDGHFLSQAVLVSASCGPTALSAASRVNHGTCGTFDIPMPLTCPSGVEDRSTGGNYTLVVTFDSAITAAGTASVTCHNPGTGTGTAGAATASGNTVSVPLTGVSDAQTLTVHIAGVTSATGTSNVDIPMGFLIGDTNGNRVVNAADIALTKSHLGETVTAANFREDVNANCAINAADVAIVKSKSGGAALPACCP